MARLKKAGRKPAPIYKKRIVEPAGDDQHTEEETGDSMEEEEAVEGDPEAVKELLTNIDEGSFREGSTIANCESNENAGGKNEVFDDPPLSEKEEQVHLEATTEELNPDRKETLATEVGDCELQSSVNLESDQNKKEGNEEVEDASLISQEKQKQNQMEIKIQGLDKGAVEEDLIEVFKKFGEVQAVRIVRNQATGNSRGFAFLQYATLEQTMNVLHEQKDGIEVRGRHVKLLASQKNSTLLIGNISKLWKIEHVIKQLKVYEIEQFKDVQILGDPEKEGTTLGIAFLEFSNHCHAVAAVQRLRSPDVFFGCDRSALVLMCSKEEALSQVKTVYVKGLTRSWDEEKLKDICKQYGEIEYIRLAGKFRKLHKPFAFVAFTSWESALACVNGINKSQLGVGKTKVEAELAKCISNSQLHKNERGKKNRSKFKDAEKQSQRKEQTGNSNDKARDSHGNAVAHEKREVRSGFKSGEQKQHKDANRAKIGQKREKILRTLKDGGKKILEGNHKDWQSKNDIGKAQDKQGKRNPGRKHRSKERAHPGNLHETVSGSKRQHFDMEPHAGYLERGIKRQTEYYLDPRQVRQGESHTSYSRPATWIQGLPSVGNLGSTLGTQGLPHAGLLAPAIGNQGYAVYDHRQIRARGYVGQDNIVSTYATGSAVPPTYTLVQSNHGGYQGHATPSSYQLNYGAYPPHGKLY